jgi:hypothetical protein
MTLLRYSIYAGGGILLALLWMLWAMTSEFATSLVVIVVLSVLGVLVLYGVDRATHAALFGQRVKFRIKEYVPCDICPFTKEAGTVLRHFIVFLEAGGFAGVVYRLPILVSASYAAQHAKLELFSVPGLKVARFTNTDVVLYLRDRDYYQAFLARNERAIVE